MSILDDFTAYTRFLQLNEFTSLNLEQPRPLFTAILAIRNKKQTQPQLTNFETHQNSLANTTSDAASADCT